MTKQEAISKAWTMLEILEAIPDGVDILNAEVREYDINPAAFHIHLNGGIELVSKSLGLPVSAHTPEDSDYIHREIKAKNCEYCQLDEKAAPGVTSTGGGKAEQGPTQDTPIITTGKEEVKP